MPAFATPLFAMTSQDALSEEDALHTARLLVAQVPNHSAMLIDGENGVEGLLFGNCRVDALERFRHIVAQVRLQLGLGLARVCKILGDGLVQRELDQVRRARPGVIAQVPGHHLAIGGKSFAHCPGTRPVA